MRLPVVVITVGLVLSLTAVVPASGQLRTVGSLDLLAASGGQGLAPAVTAEATLLSFTIVDSLELDPVTVTELLGDADGGISAGTFVGSVEQALAVDLGSPLTGPSPNTSLRRQAADVWQAWVRGSTNGITAEYRLVPATGEPGSLEDPALPESKIPVVLQPLGPTEIFRSGPWRLLQGGVAMDLDLSDTTHAGRYEAILEVVVYQL